MEPLVSICCITYNHVAHISQCLDGFLMQKTTFIFEILIHDDASTDGTADIIRKYVAKYPHLIKPVYQVENQYSKGVKIMSTYNYSRARGKYIALCEGDDYWIDPLKLQNRLMSWRVIQV
ncbi:glycosyltransferase family 2 protein [Bacteroides fragilis]